jgi:hypothetical protein
MQGMAAPAKVKRARKRRAPAPAPASLPFLRFHHSEALRAKTLAVLGKVERAEDAAEYRDSLADVVVELTNAGLNDYFMKPLKCAKPGFVVQQSATLGMAGAQQVMATVIRQVIGRMGHPQLLSVCGSIRQFMK